MNSPLDGASPGPVFAAIADRLPAALAVALNCVSTPTFLVQADGRLVHANLAGERILQGGHALKKSHSSCLVARRLNEATALKAVVSRVAGGRQPELLRLLNRNGTSRLLLTVSPVSGHALAVVCVADLQPGDADLTQWFRQAFQLSVQNAELAAGLISGLSLSEFSAQKAVTLGATRTRLKKLFAHTGTSSQAALVAALLRAAVIAIPPGRGE
jgi:hypothetical protein